MNQETNIALYESLNKLSTVQLKTLYTMLSYYWVEHRYFLSEQNFFNLWCELNLLCHEFDESFPDLYYDYNEIKSFCQSKPYYFFDMLDTKLVVKLFCEYFDDKINILMVVADKLCTEGLRAAYEYINETMGLSENIDELVQQAEDNIKAFS